jgi:GNAT superfamily N-acetyltransferase
MKKLEITYATQKNFQWLKKRDCHITESMLKKKISDGRILIAQLNNEIIGWLRFGFFWDIIPFMNFLFIEDGYRRKGIGKKIVRFWEKEMKKNKHKFVMTSTQADEEGQYFYRKIGYHDIGALFELNDVAAEIFLIKEIKK